MSGRQRFVLSSFSKKVDERKNRRRQHGRREGQPNASPRQEKKLQIPRRGRRPIDDQLAQYLSLFDLGRGATYAEVKAQYYRSRALRLHPDKQGLIGQACPMKKPKISSSNTYDTWRINWRLEVSKIKNEWSPKICPVGRKLSIRKAYQYLQDTLPVCCHFMTYHKQNTYVVNTSTADTYQTNKKDGVR